MRVCVIACQGTNACQRRGPTTAKWGNRGRDCLCASAEDLSACCRPPPARCLRADTPTISSGGTPAAVYTDMQHMHARVHRCAQPTLVQEATVAGTQPPSG